MALIVYKRVCRKAERQSRRYLTEKLMNIGMNDPKSFWSIVNKMNSWGNERMEDTEHINPIHSGAPGFTLR